MIGDVVRRSLGSPRVLIPVEQLLGDASGSRMPEVRPELLTENIARRVVGSMSHVRTGRGKSRIGQSKLSGAELW